MGNLELKNRLVELKQKKAKLAFMATEQIRYIKSAMSTASFDPIEQIKADEVEIAAGKLAETRREYVEVLDLMREIEKELA